MYVEKLADPTRGKACAGVIILKIIGGYI